MAFNVRRIFAAPNDAQVDHVVVLSARTEPMQLEGVVTVRAVARLSRGHRADLN